jgi:hypothetical protein
MPKHKRQRVPGRYSVECKTDIRMAEAAARNLYDNVVRAGVESRELKTSQTCTWSRELEPVCALNARNRGPLRVDSCE